jgi:beta-galactosidase
MLYAHEVRDRAQVFVDGLPLTVFERESSDEVTTLAVPPEGITLDLLVENMGRVNFGPGLLDRKGIVGGVLLDWQFQFGWEVYPLPLRDLTRLEFKSASAVKFPSFFRGTFNIETPADTFVSFPGWTKGVAWINGFNLGRYWNRGPQRTLYVPSPVLKNGDNEMIIIELQGVEKPEVEFLDHPDLG